MQVTSGTTSASLVAPRDEDGSSSYRSMPSLASYRSDTESDDELVLESVIDVTRLYRY